MQDPYVYPGTDVLRNLLNERDPTESAALELELASLRAVELTGNPTGGAYDFAHLCAIHQHLFQDMYDWAGRPRTVQTAKGVPFCPPANIDEQSRFIHRNIVCDEQLNSTELDTFADRLAYHWAEVNAVHAFREGNTRTQRAFFEQLAELRGWEMDFDALDYTAFKTARHHALVADHHQFAGVLKPILRRSIGHADPPGQP